MKTLRYILLIFASIGLIQCKDAEDPAQEQSRKDRQRIEKYALENDLTGSFIGDLYKTIISEGTGTSFPQSDEGVKVHYTISILDGGILQQGESLYQHGQYFYIYGWELGVSTMKEGEFAKFLIPSGLGYGNKAFSLNDVTIPANSILILEIELKSITKTLDIPKAYATSKNLTTKVTSSGLVYAITTPGAGELPKSGQKITVKYNGYLLNEYSFDHSDSYSFELGSDSKGFIQGWQEAIPLLRKGDKAVLIIPSNLGYGAKGATDNNGTVRIPPNAVIIFDIEILDIK